MVEEKEIEGIIIFETEVFRDDRGYFMEFYNEKRFNHNLLENFSFKQDNISCSKKNVLRGLHFQAPPFEQGKLIQVLKGKVIDVVVDLRRKSNITQNVLVEVIFIIIFNKISSFIPKNLSFKNDDSLYFFFFHHFENVLLIILLNREISISSSV